MYNYWETAQIRDCVSQLWSNRLNCQLMTMLEMMHILQAQVCGCISAHIRLPHQKIKWEPVTHQKFR